ncbi:hypothetical protein Tco_1446334 [Tanacetum coccineum]
MMTAKYYPRNKIKKLEMEIWELKYVDGLPDMIHGSVMVSKPKTMHYEVEFKTELMDKKIHTFAECQGLVRRIHTVDLSQCALNATITMMVRMLPNATSATELAIWPMTIGVLHMPILLTTKGALRQTSFTRIDGPPIMPEDPNAYILDAIEVPPTPDYISVLEVPPSPDYILPEEAAVTSLTGLLRASPTADSPGYVPESDPDEELEEEMRNPERIQLTTLISIQDEPSKSLPPRVRGRRLLALTTPPPSPLTHYHLHYNRYIPTTDKIPKLHIEIQRVVYRFGRDIEVAKRTTDTDVEFQRQPGLAKAQAQPGMHQESW